VYLLYNVRKSSTGPLERGKKTCRLTPFAKKEKKNLIVTGGRGKGFCKRRKGKGPGPGRGGGGGGDARLLSRAGMEKTPQSQREKGKKERALGPLHPILKGKRKKIARGEKKGEKEKVLFPYSIPNETKGRGKQRARPSSHDEEEKKERKEVRGADVVSYL